ncbi:hypothetical protein C8J57DRAFT_136041 [Mycena rebaudengoi]|nr:hypothetical protein C8J57DRAFT_136041 [Mycena rebaudengoi]
MSSVVVTQSQPRTQRGTGKRGNNRGRGASRGPNQPRTTGKTPQETNKLEAEVILSATSDVADPAAEDGAICWICAEPVKYYALSECNHRTCHVCALRLRALYKKTDCTFCKDPQPVMVFTISPDALFASFDTSTMQWKDAKLGISFETQEMMEETVLLLRFNCPDAECVYLGNGWGDLKLHTRATHGRLMCDLCIRFKKVFAHEHVLYPPNILPLHLPSMLPHSRPNKAGKGKDKEQIDGGTHPLCEFCRECFFGDDELFAHMREAHEECFVCKRNDVRDQYFLNYAALEAHFNNAHHPCPHSPCPSRKFVVFGSALDLQAHVVEEHGGEMGKGGRRDARRVEAGWDEVRSGQGHGHGRGRGREREPDRDRDRDREPPPHQQAAPQPQRPNGGGGGRRREGFGASLTVEGESTPTPTPSPPPPRADVDPAVAERHAVFLSRLASLSPNPTTALPAARAAIRSFRASESSARDLISTLFSVVDSRMEAAGSIVNSFVDLLDEGEQREAVLAAWRGFEVEQRRQFPELVPVPSAVGSGYAGIASGRVLNAKHATAGRGGRQSTQVWDRVAQAASSSTQRFPALGPASAVASSSTAPRPGQRNTPWSASASGRPAAPAPTFAASSAFVPPPNNGSSQSTVTPFSTHMPASSSKAPPKLSNTLFPELQPSPAARQKAPVGGNQSLRNILGTAAPSGPGAWGAGPGASSESAAASTDAAVGAGGGKKKGKGKGKQTLFTLGTFPS